METLILKYQTRYSNEKELADLCNSRSTSCPCKYHICPMRKREKRCSEVTVADWVEVKAERTIIYEEYPNNLKCIDEAVQEATRFIERARLYKEQYAFHLESSSMFNVAVKRASMDLTRALVKVRNPDKK